MSLIPSSDATSVIPVKEDEFFLGWYGKQVAKLGFNGVNWSFHYETGWMLPLSGNHDEYPGELPAFVLNLMPEVHQGRPDDKIAMEEVLRHSDRFLSNIVISKKEDKVTNAPIDRLEGRLADYSEETVFTGSCNNMPSMGGSFLQRMDDMVVSCNVPRMSGCQAKMPCHLSEDGTLAPAVGSSFTHILKFPGLQNDPAQVRGAIEWLSMSLAKAGGVNTCEFSLVEMQNNVLAYVAERFDIPVNQADPRLIYCEDFCATSGNTPNGKYWNTIEAMIDTLQKVTTQKKEDGLDFFKLIYANKLLENGDFHLKNAAILREVSPQLNAFLSTKLAPAYDIMNTRYFNPRARPAHMPEKMALSFEDDKDNYTHKHLITMAQMLGISKGVAQETMFNVANGIAQKAKNIAMDMPQVFEKPAHAHAQTHVAHACFRALTFCHHDFPDIDISMGAKSKGIRP